MIVVSDGSHDALLLEWTGGPENVTRWQYRERAWVNRRAQPWGIWQNVPGSSATTTSYRLTGLSAGSAYDVQVRAVTGTTPGAPSNVGEGLTYPTGRIPYIDPGELVEGDGRTEWRIRVCGCTVVIPNGMRVEVGRSGVPDNGPVGTGIIDVATGSQLALGSRGHEIARRIVTPVSDGGAQNLRPIRDVSALFDQIVASVRLK